MQNILRLIIITLIIASCARKTYNAPDQALLASMGSSVKAFFQHSADESRAIVDTAPDNYNALYALSEADIYLYIFGYKSREETLPGAVNAFNRLWQIDSLSSRSLKLKGVFSFLNWNWKGAETYLIKSIAADPGNLDARHWYALYLAAMGRLDEAMVQSDSIVPKDPDFNYIVSRASLLYFARWDGEMRDLLTSATERDTTMHWAYDWLGMAYCELKDFDRSIEVYHKAFRLSDGTVEVGAGLGHALGLAGAYGPAKEMADYYAQAAESHYIPPIQRAFIHIGIGEYDKALELLEQAYRERSWFLIFMNVEPWYDPVRKDQRFRDIVARMSYPEFPLASTEPIRPMAFSAEAAPEWTALMERTSGWFAADGIFTIPLDGREVQQDPRKKTLFVFSDTYIGEVENNVPKPGNVMVNNTTAWMKGCDPDPAAISFRYNTLPDGTPTSWFVPDNEASEQGEYFWLGDGFVNQEKNNALYLFAYHVHKTGPGVFDFAATNVALLKIKTPTPEGIKHYEQMATGLGFVHPVQGRVYFGSGIFVNTREAGAPDPDGYVYIYGIMEGRKSLIAARIEPANIEKFGQWTFWNGSGWSHHKEDAAPICDAVSNELSVNPSGDGRYLLTFTVMGLSEKIGIRVGDSPVGPFGEIHEVYTCPEYAEKGLFPYNAKAHYHLSRPGELLVSYNTITLNFWEDIQKDATIYHPRFVWVRYK